MKTKILLSIILIQFVSYANAQTPINSLKFDGVDDRITTALPSVFNSIGTTNITIETWVNPQGNTFSRILFAQLNPTNFISVTVSATNQVYFYINNTLSLVTTNTLTLNQWSHIACTWDASTSAAQIYINGVLQATSSGGTSSTGTDNIMNIGSRTNGAQYFNGELDELRIWSVLRLPCEIVASMNSEFTIAQPNLIANYNFNQGVAGGTNTGVASLPDLTSNYNGTLLNFALTGTASNWLSSNAVINQLNYNSAAIPTIMASSSNTLICPGTPVNLSATGATSYTWDTGSNLTTIAVSPTTTTTYTLMGTDANGCMGSTTITQNVSTCTDINNLSSNISNFLVYPNPSNGILNIELAHSTSSGQANLNENAKIEITNSLGEIVLTENLSIQHSSTDSYRYNIHHFSNGIYFVKVINGNDQTTKRFIINK